MNNKQRQFGLFLLMIFIFCYMIIHLYFIRSSNGIIDPNLVNGDITYYSAKEGIYRLDIKKDENKLISSNSASTYYNHEDYVYYKKVHSSDIYRIHKSTLLEEYICSDVIHLKFFEELIVYIQNGNRFLYAMTLDGKKKIALTDYPISKFRIEGSILSIYDKNSSVIEIERSSINLE